MTMTVVKPGLQSTLQSRPRTGLRHQGVPAGGAADPLSLALANRLVGNAWDATALEVTLAGPVLRFERDCAYAFAGAAVPVARNGIAVEAHETLFARAGDELVIGPATAGARLYLAVAGGFDADDVLGSSATNLQAAFGGFGGRALQAGDALQHAAGAAEAVTTPAEFRPPMAASRALRVCESAETPLLDGAGREALFGANWVVDRRADRMGLRLDGPPLSVASEGRMPSAGVLPGTIQCPGDAPYLLGVDAGTVGGYPRVAQVTRADRHLMGQLRPGDRVRLLHREPEEAVAELRAKVDYWSAWLPDAAEIF